MNGAVMSGFNFMVYRAAKIGTCGSEVWPDYTCCSMRRGKANNKTLDKITWCQRVDANQHQLSAEASMCDNGSVTTSDLPSHKNVAVTWQGVTFTCNCHFLYRPHSQISSRKEEATQSNWCQVHSDATERSNGFSLFTVSTRLNTSDREHRVHV